jgi:hypothetical protein
MLNARSAALLCALAASLAACGDDESPESGTDASADTGTDIGDGGGVEDATNDTDTGGVPDSQTDAEGSTDASPDDPAADCDPLQPSVCSLPWPSNLYLEADPSRETGYTLAFGDTTLPLSARGQHIAPDDYRRLDGYGVGTPVMVHFPGIDLAGMATEYNPEPSLAEDAPVLLFKVDGDTLTRVPYWIEVDSHASDLSRQVTFVRPAVLLEEGTRYIVAFRGIQNTDGVAFERSPAFAALVNRESSLDPVLSQRQARFDEIFDLLEAEGVTRDSLTLAWDWFTASGEALHGPLLHMRDEALEAVGENGPTLTITETTAFTPEENAQVAYELRGTFEAPHYMNPEPVNAVISGWRMNMGDDGLPEPVGTRTVKWWATIPQSAVADPETPNGLIEYGHGLLGEGEQVWSGFNDRIAHENHFIIFGCEMIGMAAEDYTNVLVILQDLSRFHWLSDRLHQGLIEHLLLARAFREQAATLAPIAENNITIDSEQLYYSGISQGGIFGATLMALSTDITRGHLGVPGNNYSTLLHRSVDFEPFFDQLAANYPDAIDQALALASIQLLWDATDPVSHLRHISADPYPNTPSHAVMLVPAKGDYQVSVNTNEVAARSDIGIALMANYDDERTVWGIEETPYPHTGSGLVLYDFGNPWPADNINLPPNDEVGDPHELPRRQAWHDRQLVTFFRTGEIIDVCNGDGCTPE